MGGKFTSPAKILDGYIGGQFSLSVKIQEQNSKGGNLVVKFQDTSQNVLFFLGIKIVEQTFHCTVIIV